MMSDNLKQATCILVVNATEKPVVWSRAKTFKRDVDTFPCPKLYLPQMLYDSSRLNSLVRRTEPLHTNHCLCTYSKATRVRQSLPRTCLSWSNSQKRAYYGLIYPNTVLNKVNMTPCFRHGSVDIETDDWLECVTLI